MRRRHLIALAATPLLVVLGIWVAQRTQWEQVRVPMPLQGEARTNPFYAVQRFAEALGARTQWVRSGLDLPPGDGVVVLSGWHWDLSPTRTTALKQWVESGGRLVVDDLLVNNGDDFDAWSGIRQKHAELDEDAEDSYEDNPDETGDQCPGMQELHGTVPGRDSYRLCDAHWLAFLEARGPAPQWALQDELGLQVVRVGLGRGSLTVINAVPFRERELFDGDHGRLFVAVSQLRKGDVVHFLSEDQYPSLLALIWRNGAAVVILSLGLIAALLWRGAVRFGPLAAVPESARRSVAEQIRGAAQFALRFREGDALHAAAVRALDEAGERRIAAYRRLSAPQRALAVARHTGLDADLVASAVAHTTQRSQALAQRIALLETARRQLLHQLTGTAHVAE